MDCAPEEAAPSSSNDPLPATPNPSPFGSLVQAGSMASAQYSLAGKEACVMFTEAMERGGNLPLLKSAERSRGEWALSWYKAMATHEEKGILMAKPPERDAARCREVARSLDKLVVARLAKGYIDAGQPTPKSLKNHPNKKLLVNSLDEHKKALNYVISRAAFQQWRMEHEEHEAAPPSAAPSAAPPSAKRARPVQAEQVDSDSD